MLSRSTHALKRPVTPRGLSRKALQMTARAVHLGGINPPPRSLVPNRILSAAFDAILERYWGSAPSASRVLQQVFQGPQGYGPDQVYHDHFAFRTYGLPGLGIESLGVAIEGFGYSRQDYYAFPNKDLLAAWYAPPEEQYEVLPRIFVSELQVEKLSRAAQDIISATAEQARLRSTSPAAAATAQGSGRGTGADHPSWVGRGQGLGPIGAWTAAVTGALPWAPPSYQDYTTLLEESEYAAWVLLHGYSLNHTALSVHRIAPHQGDIYSFANNLVMRGFDMNHEGGLMKVSPDAGLLQCSTVADMVDYTFKDGQARQVAGAYLEFVERKPLVTPAGDAKKVPERQRKDGFEAASANHIFASTTLAAVGGSRGTAGAKPAAR